MKRVILVFATMMFICSCAAQSAKPIVWSPPVGGVVRDARAAVAIARIIWLSIHPELEAKIGSEAVWLEHMHAELYGDIWEVATKMKRGEIGGGLYIHISRTDGRIVDIQLTQ